MSRPDVICVGAANLDTIAVLEVIPDSDARVETEIIFDAGGGPAATAAVTLARLGIAVGFCGVVGDDTIGSIVRQGLEDEGVDTTWLVTEPDFMSTRSLVLIESKTGSRTIVAGRSRAPSPETIPLDVARWLHVDQVGYAPTAAATRSVDLPPLVSLDGGNPIAGLNLADIDLYVPTLSALSLRYPGMALAAAMARALGEGPSSVVATAGARGSYAFDGNEVVHVPAVYSDVVSTLGAGDVFHGALLAGIVSDLDLPTAIRLATAIASQSCGAIDGRSGIPKVAVHAALDLATRPVGQKGTDQFRNGQ